MSRSKIAVVLCAALLAGCSRKPSVGSEAAARPAKVSWMELGEKAPAKRLLKGFHNPEPAWRWTEQVFAVALDAPATNQQVFLELYFGLAEAYMKQLGSVTLTARVNGAEVGSETYTRSGQFVFSKPVPLELLRGGRATVEFALDKAVRPDGPNGAQLGLVAASVGLKPRDNTEPFRQEQARTAQAAYQEILRQRALKMEVARQRELMKLFHELDIWKNMWFQGVQLIKNPLDLWMMQQIIWEVRPDYIIETGTWRGGSALYWAHTLHGMGLENSRVLTVDLQDQTQTARTRPLWQKYVQFFPGSSTDPQIVSRIAHVVKGKRVLVTLDSDHSMNHVLEELRLYSPLVSPGSYLVVEDTHIDGIPTFPHLSPGPTAAVNRFLEQGGSKMFERDLTREALVMTFNPGGWLRRKK